MKMKTHLAKLLTGITLCCWCGMTEGNRQKRYLFINSESPITLGFILNMPISLALPKLIKDSIKGRSFGSENEELEEDFESPEDLYWDPAYEQELNRLSIYFEHMEMHSLSCREKLLCELAAEPENFSPISEIFLKELRLLHGRVKTAKDSLMWRYMAASREGFTNSIKKCKSLYPTCPLAAYKIINVPLLRIWQFIAAQINLRLI